MTVHVAWTGIDRDALLRALEERGLEPRVRDDADEPTIEIECTKADAEQVCAEVVAEVEKLIDELGLALVPERAEDRVFLRPPAA